MCRSFCIIHTVPSNVLAIIQCEQHCQNGFIYPDCLCQDLVHHQVHKEIVLMPKSTLKEQQHTPRLALQSNADAAMVTVWQTQS
jgi:hypothetical protein